MKAQFNATGLAPILIAAIALLLPLSGEAQVKQMSAQELTMESTSILYGTCTNMESAWTGDGEMILTTVTVVPEYYLKGNLGSEVTITVPGGQVGDILYEVSEMPAFQKGEEVFAFIWTHPSGVNLVTGGYQGKLKIDKDKKTGIRTVPGKALGKEKFLAAQESIRPDKTTTPAKTKPEKVSLDDFTKEVEGYMNKH
jgi:hypothetical protein